MKPIEQDKLDQLLTIVPDHPMVRLLHFADSGTELPEGLHRFAKARDYEYQINCTEQTYAQTMQEHFSDNTTAKVRYFPLARPRYMQQGKLYDFVFVTSDIPEETKEAFLQKTHPVIKNGGSILLFIPKKDHAQRFAWMQMLEENYYVATSTIDDLFEHYDLLISRKMHGWGG